MEIKNLFPEKEKNHSVKGPWEIKEIENGLKARSVKLVGGMIISGNKKVPVQYYEYDRIFGRNAFSTVLRVMEMFDELRDITPNTTGYIFRESIYLNYGKGILKRNMKTLAEKFFSEETLRNENIANYLQLSTDPGHEEEHSDREIVHSDSTELQTT